MHVKTMFAALVGVATATVGAWAAGPVQAAPTDNNAPMVIEKVVINEVATRGDKAGNQAVDEFIELRNVTMSVDPETGAVEFLPLNITGWKLEIYDNASSLLFTINILSTDSPALAARDDSNPSGAQYWVAAHQNSDETAVAKKVYSDASPAIPHDGGVKLLRPATGGGFTTVDTVGFDLGTVFETTPAAPQLTDTDLSSQRDALSRDTDVNSADFHQALRTAGARNT